MQRRLRRLLPDPAAVFLLGVLAYSPQLRPGWAPPGGDLFNYVLPNAAYLQQAWAQGRWPPLWDPGIFMGVPFLANIQSQSLYPPSLLLLAVPALPAIAWLQALHVGLAGAGMYEYGLRGARLGRPGAAVASAAYMLGPYLTGQMAHVNQLDTLAWCPWLMLAVDRTLVRPTRLRVTATAIVVGLVLLAGHPQQAYFSLILGTFAALARIWPRLKRGRAASTAPALAAVLGGVALGVGLAAAQLLPTLELVVQSVRSHGVEPSAAADSPLLLRGLLGAGLPHYSSQVSPEITGAALGATTLALAGVALVARWRRPFVRAWSAVGLVSLWAATGHSGRLYDVLYHVVPGLFLFRAPSRILVLATVALALLAGHGTRVALVLARSGRTAQPVILAGLLALMPPAAIGAYEAVGMPDQRWLRLLPSAPGPPLPDLLLNAAFVLATMIAVLLAARAPRIRRGLGPALLLLVVADTWLATEPIYSRHAEPAPGVAGLGARRLIEPDLNSRYLSLVASDEGLQPNQGLVGGWLDADGYDGGVLPLQRYIEFRVPLLAPGSANRPDFILPFVTDRIHSIDRLRETGATQVVAAEGRIPDGGDCQCLVAGPAADGVRVWSIPGATGRAWLEAGGERRPQRVIADAGERVVVAVEAPAPGLLVLADTDYPGWLASVDGRAVPIRRHLGLLRAVPVPAGSHVVVFAYEPASARFGAAISVLSALCLLLILGAPAGRRLLLRRSWRA